MQMIVGSQKKYWITSICSFMVAPFWETLHSQNQSGIKLAVQHSFFDQPHMRCHISTEMTVMSLQRSIVKSFGSE